MIIPPPHHINVVPEKPEDIYEAPQGLAARMMLHDANRLANPGALLNRVVYDCIDQSPIYAAESNNNSNEQNHTTKHSSSSHSNNSANNNNSKPILTQLKPYYIPMGADDTTLVFESRFESGNLRRAVQV